MARYCDSSDGAVTRDTVSHVTTPSWFQENIFFRVIINKINNQLYKNNFLVI